MAEASVFRSSIGFLNEIGVYDVVLPFLLVFTIVYAIMDKTKVLGIEVVDNVKYPKKNLNAMTAFVIAFLVVASTRLVALINEALANIVILLLISVFFLLLVGSFYREGEDVFLEKGWRKFFMIIMFIGIVLIFLHAVKTSTGSNWLEWIYDQVFHNFDSTAVGSIILLILVVVIIMWGVSSPKPKGEKKEEKKD